MLLVGVAFVGSQLGHTYGRRGLLAKLSYLLRATLDGGEQGEGRIAAAGFALIVAGVIVFSGATYALIHP
jgi:hypothetical protein